MCALTIDIPEEIVDAARLPRAEIEQEFRTELALALYQRGILSLGKSRLLAQMTRWEFDELLGRRQIVRHYTQTDLEDDIQYAFGRQ